MSKKRAKAPHHADGRNGRWAGIPHVVLNSDAYVDLTVFARAVLIEIVRNFNGYNNGEIGVGYDHLIKRLGNQNKRKIKQAFVDLMSHGFISTEAEADWKGRRTREYRLTFVNTTPGGRHKPATNEYRDWAKEKQKAGVTPSPLTPINGDTVSPIAKRNGDTSSPDRFQKWLNTGENSNLDKTNNGDALSPHIDTIPLSEKKEERSASEFGYTHDKDGNGPLDFDAAIHAQITTGWNALSSQAKTTLAQRHGVSALEIDSYLRGEQHLSPAKLMAIRSDLSLR